MRKALRAPLFAIILLLGLAFVRCGADKSSESGSPARLTKSTENLITAHKSEIEASASYIAYAKIAEKEGMPAVSRLFKALAKAEDIHSKNFMELITKAGAKTEPYSTPVTIKSTKEALEAAKAKESFETESVYPGFIKNAQSENAGDAVKAFSYAMHAETSHYELIKLAAGASKEFSPESTAEFLICPICGLVVIGEPRERCPVCMTSASKFIK